MISLKNPVGQHSIMEVSPLLLSLVSNSIIVIIEGVHKILTTVMTSIVVNKTTNYAKPRSIRYRMLTRVISYGVFQTSPKGEREEQDMLLDSINS